MHPEAMQGVRWAGEELRRIGWTPSKVDRLNMFDAIDVGGSYINGHARNELDYVAGRGRDPLWTITDIESNERDVNPVILWDATKTPPAELKGKFELALCTEVLEHVLEWDELVHNVALTLVPGGAAVFTCASTRRRPHGARGALDPAPSEWYRNVAPVELQGVLNDTFPTFGFQYRANPGDLYAWAMRA